MTNTDSALLMISYMTKQCRHCQLSHSNWAYAELPGESMGEEKICFI